VGRTEYLNDPAAPKPNSLVPAAGILAVDGQGRVLLQRRRDTGQWAIPMGKQEVGETVTQCAVRETEEETGVRVEVTGLLGIYSDPGHVVFYDSDGETRQEFEIILLGRPVSGEPLVNDEASAVGWFAPDDLGVLDIHPTQWRQLRNWLDHAYPHIDLVGAGRVDKACELPRRSRPPADSSAAGRAG
jgi:8-oxo-dGTP pyrophosphatase MutT (NUDIX family)